MVFPSRLANARQARDFILPLAQGHLTRRLFRAILGRVEQHA